MWLAASAKAEVHHVVTVGKGGDLKFEPEVIRAKAGDTIEYIFFAKVSMFVIYPQND